jgi:signal peptidase I
MSDTEIAVFQKEIADKPVGERIAFWAEKFVGVPYDTDPLGEYVAKNSIVADERVDCMYLSFRAVELALSLTPDKAIDIALEKRFITKGKLDSKGDIINYEDRFQYGEDMLDSGRWGKEITEQLGKVTEIKGSRGREKVKIIAKNTLLKRLSSSKSSSATGGLKSGDFIFFVKTPEKRKAGEIVGHIGIIKVEDKGQRVKGSKGQKEDNGIYLIHAGGAKNKGGEVKKVRLYDYINSMPFIGVRVSRFN